MSLLEQFAQEFEILEDCGDELVAISRNRLKFSEHPSVHGVLYLEVQNLKYAVPHEELPTMTGFTHRQMDEADPLLATLGFVAPGFISDTARKSLWAGVGYGYIPTGAMDRWKQTCGLAVHYGYHASCQWKYFLEDVDQRPELLWALNEKVPMEALCGFYIDKPMNRMGDTGWDWMRGDIGAAMRRRGERDSCTNQSS